MRHILPLPITKLLFALIAAFLLVGIAAAQTQTSKDQGWSYPTEKPAKPFDGGDGTENSPYRIRTAQQLMNFVWMVNDGEKYKGKYFRMTDDIVLNEGVINADGTFNRSGSFKDCVGIGHYDTFFDDYFCGIFDGGGHTIYGFYRKTDGDARKLWTSALFYRLENAIVQNLNLSDSYINSYQTDDDGTGFVVRSAYKSTISSCHVKHSVIECSSGEGELYVSVGGIAGVIEKSTVKDCSFSGNIILSPSSYYKYASAGGIVGSMMNKDDNTIANCISEGNIKFIADKYVAQVAVGGIVGVCNKEFRISGCCNKMNLYAEETSGLRLAMGGIFGYLECDGDDYYIERCVNFGEFYWGAKGEDCIIAENRANLKLIGGIGTLYPNSIIDFGDLYISDCANYGSIHVLYDKVAIKDKAENDVEALDRRTLTAGCIAAKGQTGVTTRTYFTRCISVTPNNELDAGTGLKIRFAPIMGYATRQSANEPDIKTIDRCYYYADDSKCRIYQPTHLNDGLVAPHSRDKSAFYRTQPWTATRLEPWLPLAASESDTWAGYTVPVLNVLSVEELFGGGTATNPYLIYTENDLANLSAALVTHPHAHFCLMNDLYMADKPAVTSIKEELDYLGTFDGNGHCIDGLRVTRHALFDKLSGTVKNLTLTNFRGNEMDNYNTSIAGYLDGTIENCAVYGTISALLDSEYETNATIKASGIARTVDKGGVIRGCMFKGTLKASSTTSDGKTNTLGTPSCEVSGIAHYVSGKVENCYASFNLDITDGFQDYLPKRGIGSTTGSGVIRNCAFVCAEASALGNSGITQCASEADITPAMLGDTNEATWLQGAYRPVNKHTKHLTVTDPTVTDPTGQPTYLDLCPDDAWTPNKVYNLTLTDTNADDAMLMRFRNLALYNKQTNTSYIIGLMLDREKTSFDYKPIEGCTATKGATTITLKKEDALDGAPGHFLLCLPCPLRTADLPEGSQLHGLGYLPDNESKANAWVFYLTECDSVGAGVPCHVYIPDCKTGDYTLLSYGDIVTKPQGTTEYGPQGYFTPTNISKAYTGITVESDNNTPVYLTYTEGSTAMKLFSAAAKSATRTDKQWLNTLRILDEEDPYLHQSLHELHGTTKDNLYVKRGLVGGKWNTLTLPFEMEASTLAGKYGMDDDEFEVQALSSITTDGGGLVLNFTEATTLEAGKPYLVKPIRNCTGFDVANVYCILSEVLTPVTVSDDQYEVTMQPNYAPIVLVAGDYFLSGGNIYIVSDDMTVASKGLRAHFTANAAASEALESARLVFEGGDVTDINGISCPVQAPAGVYDLSGRRVKQPTRGLYIINGRKVIVH